jgi:hypothetical protein
VSRRKARVFERDAHRRRDRLEQADFRLAEGMLALVVLEWTRPSTRSLPTNLTLT